MIMSDITWTIIQVIVFEAIFLLGCFPLGLTFGAILISALAIAVLKLLYLFISMLVLQIQIIVIITTILSVVFYFW